MILIDQIIQRRVRDRHETRMLRKFGECAMIEVTEEGEG